VLGKRLWSGATVDETLKESKINEETIKKKERLEPEIIPELETVAAAYD
jgi:hypothetical protein